MKSLVHFDILGFDEQAKQIEKIHGIPSWQARKNVIEKVEQILQSFLSDKQLAKTALDSWMILFNSANDALACLTAIRKAIEKEYNLILIESCLVRGSISCDEFWLTNAAMTAAKMCTPFRQEHKRKFNDFPRKSFTLIHESAMEELSASENLSFADGGHFDNDRVYVLDLDSMNYPSKLSLQPKQKTSRRASIESINMSVFDPSHIGSSLSKHIKNSHSIDLYLYSGETFAITYRKILLQHRNISLRVLLRNPKVDPEKRTAIEGCLALLDEVSSDNSNCKIQIKTYDHSPLLRALIFNNEEGFLGLYRFSDNEQFHFHGIEDNRLLYARSDNNTKFLLDIFQSRFELDWREAKPLKQIWQ